VAQTAFIALVHDQPGSQELPAGVVAREGREGGRKGGREGDLAQTAFIALVNDQPGSQELSAGVVAKEGRKGKRVRPSIGSEMKSPYSLPPSLPPSPTHAKPPPSF